MTSSRVHLMVPVSSARPVAASSLTVGSIVIVTFVQSLEMLVPSYAKLKKLEQFCPLFAMIELRRFTRTEAVGKPLGPSPAPLLNAMVELSTSTHALSRYSTAGPPTVFRLTVLLTREIRLSARIAEVGDRLSCTVLFCM